MTNGFDQRRRGPCRYDLEAIDPHRWDKPAPVVALGTFDGVHLGHRAIIRWAAQKAAALSGTPIAFTFDRHPQEVVGKGAPPLLTDLEEKLELLEQGGAACTVVARFDRAFSSLTALEFIENILVERLNVRAVVCGFNFRFGQGAVGDPHLLKQQGKAWGFEVHVVEPVLVDGVAISSSAIRACLQRGDVERAARWLGRPYRLRGFVERGEGRGRQIGYPTANVRPPAGRLVPAPGVYIARAYPCAAGWGMPGGEWPPGRSAPREAEKLPALAVVGGKRTFGLQAEAVEVHLLNRQEDLYGQQLWVEFLAYLRGIVPFPGVDALVEQIRRDVEGARAYFGL